METQEKKSEVREEKIKSAELLKLYLQKIAADKLKNKPIVVSVEPGVPIWAQCVLLKGLVEFLQMSGMRHSYSIIHRGAWREKYWKIQNALMPFGSVDYIIDEAKKDSGQAGVVSGKKMLNLIAIEPGWSDVPRYEIWLIKSPMNEDKVAKKLIPSVSGSKMTVIISTNWYPDNTDDKTKFSQKEKKAIIKLCLWRELKKIFKLELHGQHYVDDCEIDRKLSVVEIMRSVPSAVLPKTSLCEYCLKKLKELE